MAYAKILLNFETMDKAYKDYLSLPPPIKGWLKEQNDREDAENEKRTQENVDRANAGEKPLPMLHHSTSCCMQVSLSFNATNQPIPKAGSRDRDNTTLNDGMNYILTVDEFRAYLTYKYGPTDVVTDLASIKGKKGVLLFGSAHIEFWDGENIFQSIGGAKKRGGNPSAVMAAGMVSSPQRWFWELSSDASAAVLPDWAQGWWTVWDGNYYYYFFHPDGMVNYIETKPHPKWTPPKTIGNQGQVTLIPNGLHIEWTPTTPGGEPTKEDFTLADSTNPTKMNGVSNKYSPLVADKM